MIAALSVLSMGQTDALPNWLESETGTWSRAYPEARLTLTVRPTLTSDWTWEYLDYSIAAGFKSSGMAPSARDAQRVAERVRASMGGVS